MLVKLSPSGTVVWTRQLDLAASNVYVATRDLAVSPNGNVQVAGTLGRDVDLGGGLLNHVGGMDVLLLTLDPFGNHLASSAHGGSEEQNAAAPSFDSDGNLTFLSFGGSADFGGGTLLNTALVKLTPSNEFLWGRDQMPFVSSVSRQDGSVAAVGVFAGNVNVGGTSLNTLGGTDIVVAVYEP